MVDKADMVSSCTGRIPSVLIREKANLFVIFLKVDQLQAGNPAAVQ